MTNIEKALEAHPRPWSRGRCIEHTNLTSIETSDGTTVLMGPVNIPLVDLIVAAVNAYEPEKVCEACGGTGGYNREHEDTFRAGDPKCPTCNGTGKQPDARVVDSEAIHLLSLEIAKRDRAIRELEAVVRDAVENYDICDYAPRLNEEMEAALANAKEAVG